MPLTPRQLIHALMMCENQGDIHDLINELCEDHGFARPRGDFLNGWTKGDLHNIGAPR